MLKVLFMFWCDTVRLLVRWCHVSRVDGKMVPCFRPMTLYRCGVIDCLSLLASIQLLICIFQFHNFHIA